MVRYDCKFCGENVFDVVDVEHLDTLPRTWVCSGCGRRYTGEPNDSGKLIVYQEGYKRYASVYEETAERLKEVEPAPGAEEPAGDEVAEEVEEKPAEEAAGVEIKAEGPTEDQPEQVAAEESEGTEDLSAEEKEEPREAEATE